MPDDFDHPTLGHLTFDHQLDAYAAQITVEGRPVAMHIVPGGVDGNGPGMKAAAGLALSLGTIASDAKQHAADALLGIKNGAWLEMDEPEVTPEGFMARMQLESVAVNEDGSVDLYFDDGDLFWRHVIVVERDKNGAFGVATIAG